MNPLQIPFHQPNIDEQTIEDVAEVLRSGWLTSGPKAMAFEKAFAESCNAKHAIFLNSGTAALHLSIDFLNLKDGDEVIMSPMTFAATAEVVEYYQAKPVFVDIRLDTMNIDETQIEAAITERTKAIIAVHYAGQPCEMDSILSIAQKHQLMVIEDAAHCTPASYKGKRIGSISDATCFSFYANKCITTGEGGMLTTNHDELAKAAKIKRLHGLSQDAEKRYRSGGNYRYEIITRGYKYNGTDIAAAIGLGQLKRSQEFYQLRRERVAWYREKLETCQDIQLLQAIEGSESSHYIFPIRLKPHFHQLRDDLIEALKEKGISTSVHFIPLHLHAYYSEKYNYQPDDFPEAHKAYQGLITLPLYTSLTQEQCHFVSNTLLEALRL